MTVSIDNALPIITCHKVYVAVKTAEGVYDTPVYLENLTEIGVEKTFNSSSFYAEGVEKYTNHTLGGIPVTLAVGDLTEENEILLLGHKRDKNGLIVRNINDKPKTVALMFTVEKEEGVCKGYVYYDGKFVPSGVSATTREGTANYQPKTITGNFKPAKNGDTDASKILRSEAEIEAFFADVPIPDFSEE